MEPADATVVVALLSWRGGTLGDSVPTVANGSKTDLVKIRIGLRLKERLHLQRRIGEGPEMSQKLTASALLTSLRSIPDGHTAD
uniref:Uncharacterized protein n=1 Tax=Trichuris muris TaxID=70415 RepID=A0A5S6QS87_TRIMR